MAQLSHLLLFDPDPSGLDTLTYGFEKDGFSITGTADAIKARELVSSAAPSLFLVSLRESEQVGLDLLRTTTSSPRARNIPCVAIGRDDARAGALAAGAFAFISVPAFVRDVINVCRMVAAASIAGSRPSPDGELTLPLRELDGMYFLVRALAVTGRSAVIEARHGQGRGELRFMDGTLRSSAVGTVQGLAALHQMLLWEDAPLHFKFKNVVRRGTQLSMKSSEVLEECDRFLRDFAHEARDLGVARTIYSAELDRVQPSAALPSEVVPILKLFNGQRDLAQILDESPFRIFDTFKIIKRFVADGAIQLKTALPPPRSDLSTGVSGPGALDSWLQRPSPVLGAELAVGNGGTNGVAQATAPTPRTVGPGNPSARSTSPFVALAATPGEPPSAVISGSASSAVVGHLRSRTVTKKNRADPPAAFPEDMVTPPPVLLEKSRTDAGGSREVAGKPASAVARGEIRVTPLSKRDHDGDVSAKPLQASVMVELGDLPTPKPLTVTAPPPVSAQEPMPSVIVAPMTPSPVLVAPMTPLPMPRSAPPAPTPAPVPLSPATSVGDVVEPGPVAAPAAMGPDPRRHGRSPSDNFNAIEADFFDREADLYKRESVETFDDLDSGKHTNGTPKR